MNNSLHTLVRRAPPVALLLGLLILIGSLVSGLWRSPVSSEVSITGDLAVGQQCRAAPFQHIHRPTRFVLIAPCVALTGTIQRVKLRDFDGSTVLWVALDLRDAHILAPGNAGLLVARIIPLDKPSVVVPTTGIRATLHGTLVRSRENAGRVELHPTWLIATTEVASNITPQMGLDVALSMPKAVPIGDELPLTVTVRRTDRHTVRVPEAELWMELIAPSGRTVRWVADITNTLGVAQINLAALETPGMYTVQVYAAKGRTVGKQTAALRIKRR